MFKSSKSSKTNKEKKMEKRITKQFTLQTEPDYLMSVQEKEGLYYIRFENGEDCIDSPLPYKSEDGAIHFLKKAFGDLLIELPLHDENGVPFDTGDIRVLLVDEDGVSEISFAEFVKLSNLED